MAAVAAQPYIGSKLSLISNSDIRYEGTLYQLDAQASTISLSQVRSLGTEDRRPDKPVHARDEVYEFIIFRGSDIKDITICEPARPEIFASLMKPHDPAIIEISSGPTGPSASTRGNNTRGKPTGGPAQRGGNGGPANQSMNMERGSNAGGYNAGPRGGMQQGRGQNRNSNQNRGGYNQDDTRSNNGGPSRAPRTEWANAKEKQPDFDFDASNKVLEEVEEKLRAKHAGEAGSNDDNNAGSRAPATEVKCYDPENFFDTISCEALEKRNDGGNGGSRPGFDRNQQRNLNSETFGPIAAPMNRGRSFTNQNRGGGRGNYRGQQQNWNNNYNGGGGGGQNWNRNNGNNGGYGGGGGYDNGNGRGYGQVYGNSAGVYGNNNNGGYGGGRGGNRGYNGGGGRGGYANRGQGGQRENVNAPA